jgi:glutathione S-transferase
VYKSVESSAQEALIGPASNQATLEIDGKTLSDCFAIIEYLEEAFPEK